MMSRQFWGDLMCFAFAEETGFFPTKAEIETAHDGFEPASWQFEEGWR